MPKKIAITIRLDEEIYRTAKHKANKELCMPLATLLRVFLKSFINQRGVGFYVGDHDLTELINKWVQHRKFERERGIRVNVYNQHKLKDIFDLGN